MRVKFGLMWMAACVTGLLLCVAPLVRAQSDESDADDTTVSNAPDTPTNKATDAQAIKRNTGANTMVVAEDYRIDAKIIDNSDKKDLMSEGDMVFLNAGLDVVAPGMEGTIYRKEGKIKDKKTHQLLGTQLRRVGRLVITDEVGENVCTARITMSDDAIAVGDLVHMGK